jgi:hypothetical protein
VNTLVASCSHASHAGVPCYHSLLGLVQGYRTLPPLVDFISRWEALQGTKPDWRRISFGPKSGFALAWDAFNRTERDLPTRQTVSDAVSRDKCALFPLLLQPKQ